MEESLKTKLIDIKVPKISGIIYSKTSKIPKGLWKSLKINKVSQNTYS